MNTVCSGTTIEKISTPDEVIEHLPSGDVPSQSAALTGNRFGQIDLRVWLGKNEFVKRGWQAGKTMPFAGLTLRAMILCSKAVFP
jgi:hypothetical protein